MPINKRTSTRKRKELLQQRRKESKQRKIEELRRQFRRENRPQYKDVYPSCDLVKIGYGQKFKTAYICTEEDRKRWKESKKSLDAAIARVMKQFKTK